MANRKIPTISNDRIIGTELNTTAITKEDRRAKAFIKNKEPTYYTSLRLKESVAKKLQKLQVLTRKSINEYITLAVTEYLEKEDIQKLLRKRVIED